MLITALTLCAMGSGVIKPNISSLMGMTYDQERPGKDQLRGSAFLWFYFSINIGAFLSMLFLPIVRNHYGYQVAFAIPAALMAAALTVFAAGKRFYAKEVIPPPKPEVVIPFAERMKSLAPLFGVFLLIVFFWVVYEHNDIQWVFFARDHMDLTLPSWLGGATLAPDQFQFINSILVLILAPLSATLWLRVDPSGRKFPATSKIFIGFLFTAAAPASMALAALQAEGGSKVSPLWIVLAYVLLTAGEVLVYGTGLDFSYSQAPKDMKSTITAVFLVTNALGNFVNILYAPMYERKDGKGISLTAVEFFACDTAIVLIAAVVFYFVGRKFNRTKVQGSPEVEIEKP
jgi:POT family proton-dependent oligopeptide transporter